MYLPSTVTVAQKEIVQAQQEVVSPPPDSLPIPEAAVLNIQDSPPVDAPPLPDSPVLSSQPVLEGPPVPEPEMAVIDVSDPPPPVEVPLPIPDGSGPPMDNDGAQIPIEAPA